MKIVKRILLLLLLILLIAGGTFTFLGYRSYSDALKEISLEDKINKIRSDENYITISDLPKQYLDAVVCVEDRRFYDHGAIDIISIGRAIVTNIREMDLVEGGSTITQQLAKNIYFSQKQEFTRKIAEVFMANLIEKNYSKDEILELYVNTSYFGDGYYGIREASKGYLAKEPKDMSLEESTLLAGIPNAPSVYAPTKNPELANKRRRHVVKAMLENQKLTQEEADLLLKE